MLLHVGHDLDWYLNWAIIFFFFSCLFWLRSIVTFCETAMGLGNAGTVDILNILNDTRQHLPDFMCF